MHFQSPEWVKLDDRLEADEPITDDRPEEAIIGNFLLFSLSLFMCFDLLSLSLFFFRRVMISLGYRRGRDVFFFFQFFFLAVLSRTR
jgi:hypothetical protein